ncbi:MAG: hypothetical protein AAFQ40_07080 [Cyanobacteria bacterium J06623_5]
MTNPSASTGLLIVRFESVEFPGVFLRMKASGVTEYIEGGGGVVNAQYGAKPYEEFLIRFLGKTKDEDSKIFQFMGNSGLTLKFLEGDNTDHLYQSPLKIESSAFKNVFLRIDGTGLTEDKEDGGGTVNCQYDAGNDESNDAYTSLAFIPVEEAIGQSSNFSGNPQKFLDDINIIVGIASTSFRNVCLRLDGKGVDGHLPDGGGTVNCRHVPAKNDSIVPSLRYEKFRLRLKLPTQ